jgi:hypothetical protein
VDAVLAEAPTRLLVQWDDGRSTVLVPSAGSARIEPAARRKRTRPARS